MDENERDDEHEPWFEYHTKRDPLLLEVGDVVKWHRLRRGLTQTQLGELSGLSPGFVSKVEAGVRWFNIRTLARLTVVLGIGFADDLLERVDPRIVIPDRSQPAPAESGPKKRSPRKRVHAE